MPSTKEKIYDYMLYGTLWFVGVGGSIVYCAAISAPYIMIGYFGAKGLVILDLIMTNAIKTLKND